MEGRRLARSEARFKGFEQGLNESIPVIAGFRGVEGTAEGEPLLIDHQQAAGQRSNQQIDQQRIGFPVHHRPGRDH